mmetsp:Transcript_3221/g.11119  ORF Transcript_3221/g.11119 Transcript_3221/m.11119 type:complete len:204 (-) Transcript_3221:418-1029(-)
MPSSPTRPPSWCPWTTTWCIAATACSTRPTSWRAPCTSSIATWTACSARPASRASITRSPRRTSSACSPPSSPLPGSAMTSCSATGCLQGGGTSPCYLTHRGPRSTPSSCGTTTPRPASSAAWRSAPSRSRSNRRSWQRPRPTTTCSMRSRPWPRGSRAASLACSGTPMAPSPRHPSATWPSWTPGACSVRPRSTASFGARRS